MSIFLSKTFEINLKLIEVFVDSRQFLYSESSQIPQKSYLNLP